MTQPKETEMNTNENSRTNVPEDVIVLGVASVDTRGSGNGVEGTGREPEQGISNE